MLRRIAYWVTTGILALERAGGGYYDFFQPDGFAEMVAGTGYSLHFFKILGVWKMLAAVAVLAPGLPRAKEWAYAGTAINLTAAAATHIHLRHEAADIATPFVLLGFALISYFTRPASRRLAGPAI